MSRAQTNDSAFRADPALSISPARLDFAVVAVGRTNDMTVLVRNIGGGTLVGSASVALPFSVISGGKYSLVSGQSQPVTVRYHPAAAGDDSQLVTFSGGGGATLNAHGRAATLPPPPQGLRIVVRESQP